MNVNLPAVEQSLLELKAKGVTPIEAIKAIHAAYNLSLAEAKRLFSLSPAWAAEVAASEKFQAEAIAALSKEGEQ